MTGTKRAYDLALHWVKTFNREEGQGFMIYGNTGNGKTHLAMAAMLEVHEALRSRPSSMLLRLYSTGSNTAKQRRIAGSPSPATKQTSIENGHQA